MTYPSLSLTESQVFTALRTFLLSVLPTGVEVIRAQINRVPEPSVENFVTMTPLMNERLATNITTYIDDFDAGGVTEANIKMETKTSIQLDVHGPNGANNSAIIKALFRSEYAVDNFETSGFDVIPLYASEPKQIPFLNGEQQIEERWTFDVVMQTNPVISISQDFMDTASVDVINVDATYPS